MLPPQLSTTHRALPPSLHVLQHGPQLYSLVRRSPRRGLAEQQYVQRRGCYFDRHRVWSSYLDPKLQQHLEKRRQALQHRYTESLHREALWDHNHNRHGWRLSSSWGFPPKADGESEQRPAAKWDNSDRSRRQQDGGRGFPDNEARQQQIHRRMEEIRRQVEEDPFKALFGYRMRNLGWYNSSTTSTGEDFQKLLGWGRKSFADIMSRLNRHRSYGRDRPDDIERTYRASDKLPTGSDKDQMNATEPKDPVEKELNAYRPMQAPTADEEYEYDPITMRRAPKKSKVQEDPVGSALSSHDGSVDIPVKTFRGYHAEFDSVLGPAELEPAKCAPRSTEKSQNAASEQKAQESVDGELVKYKAKYSWLEREGFSDESKSLHDWPTVSKPLESNNILMTPAIPQVQAFDIRADISSEKHAPATKTSQPNHDVAEPKTEDLDLLRPSDVRSSVGDFNFQNADSEMEKQERRKQLEEDFRSTHGLATSSEEAEAMNVLKRRTDSINATSGGDGYSAQHQDLQVSYHREIGEQRTTTEDGEENVYSDTPQRLEVGYNPEEELQKSPIREAEADGFNTTPQGLETAYAQGFEGEGEQGQGAYEKHPRGTETSYTREIDNRRSQETAPEQRALRNQVSTEAQQHVLYSELDRYRSDGAGSVSTERSSTAPYDHSGNFPPELWSKQYEKKMASAKRQRDKALIAEIKGIYEDSYGVIGPEHRMKPEQAQSLEGCQPGVVVDKALEDYEQSSSSRPCGYNFSGSDGFEAEILSKAQVENVQTIETPLASKHQVPDEQAIRIEEKEQIFDEELRETNDFLHDVRSEFEAIKAQSAVTTAQSQPLLFRILAYDPSTDEVTSGTTTYSTSSSEHKIVPPSEAILRLSHPAKFLPYLTSLKKEGYEIVSGASDVLVFCKVREQTSARSAEEDDEAPYMSFDEPLSPRTSYHSPINPVDGTTTGNFASPTGFVNHDTFFSPPFSEISEPTLEPAPRTAATASRVVNPLATEKVTREEPVFSGQRKPWAESESSSSKTSKAGEKSKEKPGKTIRRVFWVGAWVAGCSYAVGVMQEFFRTGGAEGKGVDWFGGFNKDP